MSIVAVHGPNTFGSKSIISNSSGSAYAIVNPANALIWTFHPGDKSQPAANYDWAYTGAAGTPASPIADTMTPTVTLPAGAHTVTLTLNGVAQGTFTINAAAGTAQQAGLQMAPEEEAEVSQRVEAVDPPQSPTAESDGDEDYASAGFDPAAHTIPEVEEYVEEHPEEAERIRTLEEEGKNRITLLSFLESYTDAE